MAFFHYSLMTILHIKKHREKSKKSIFTVDFFLFFFCRNGFLFRKTKLSYFYTDSDAISQIFLRLVFLSLHGRGLTGRVALIFVVRPLATLG